MTSMQQTMAVLRREVAVERAGRDLARGLLPVAIAGVLLAGLAFGPAPSVLAGVTPGLPWLVVMLLSAHVAVSVAAAEREEGCWDLLVGLVGPGPLLWGKTAAVWLWLLLTWTLTAWAAAVVLGTALAATAVPAAALGTLGLAAGVVVYGTVAARGGRTGTGLLTALIVPAGVPALLAGTQASTPGVESLPWLALLLAYDLTSLSLAWAVFPILLEE